LSVAAKVFTTPVVQVHQTPVVQTKGLKRKRTQWWRVATGQTIAQVGKGLHGITGVGVVVAVGSGSNQEMRLRRWVADRKNRDISGLDGEKRREDSESEESQKQKRGLHVVLLMKRSGDGERKLNIDVHREV
jgi:hypothetical protein